MMQRTFMVSMLLAALVGCSNQAETLTGPAPTVAVETESSTAETQPTEAPTDIGKQDAEQILAAAIARAETEDKRVFVHLGAPW